MLKKILSLLIIAVLVLSISACSKNTNSSTSSTSNSVETSETKNQAENTNNSQSQATADNNTFKVLQENFEKLNSYKMKTRLVWESKKDSSKLDTYTEFAYSKKNNAKQIKISFNNGSPIQEYIIIGNDFYMNFQGNWMKVTQNNNLNNISAQSYEDFAKYMNEISSHYQFKGNETINNVNCKKFSIDGEYEIPIPYMNKDLKSEFKPQKVKIKGDVWLADQGDLKDIAIKAFSNIEGKFVNPADLIKNPQANEASDTIIKTEHELISINEDLKIEAPKNASSIPDVMKNGIAIPSIANQPNQ